MESVTIIAPVYNEEGSLKQFFQTFSKILKSGGYQTRFLVIDDCSQDNTLNELIKIKKSFPDPITVVSLKTNSGQQRALLAGLDYVKSTDYGVITDADMQNPPTLIIPMISKLKNEKLNLIYGIRSDTRVGNGIFSKIFWFLVYLFSFGRIPKDQTPLRVFDKTFLKKFQLIKARYADFFAAVLAHIPARVGFFPVETTARLVGVSKYNLLSKLKLHTAAILVILFGMSKIKNYEVAHVYE